MPTLYVLQGPDKGRTIKTDDEIVLIGRGADQVPLTDQTVSRRHAQLKTDDHGCTLTDLGSANGTYLNGMRVTKPARLKHGDQIRVGGSLLVYGGDTSVEQLAGPSIPSDMVTLDAGSLMVDAAVMASVPSNEDSVVLSAAETVHAVKAWRVMRELSDAIGSLLPADQLLKRVLDIIFAEVEVDRGVLFMRDDATKEMVPEVVRFHRRIHGEPDAKSIVTSRTILSHVVESREGVLSTNVVGDRRFASGKSVQNLGMRSVVCAPILAREQVLGVIHLDCPVTRHTYNEHELRLITAIGYQTGLAIENARLVQQYLQRERLAAAGEAVAYLSHYIRNILQGMRSGGELVERGLARKDFATTSDGWRILDRNLDKAYNLMTNMLAFSKQREPRLEMLQINKIVEEVVSLVQKQADVAKIVLLPDTDDNLPPIPIDYDGVHQVILNLVENAIDAAPRGGGVVNVRTRYNAGAKQVVVSVSDNGPGVPADIRAKIFEPFYSTKGHAGTGLGLAVARKIVEELGGLLTLTCPADGGAQFDVRLPISQARLSDPGDTQAPTR